MVWISWLSLCGNIHNKLKFLMPKGYMSQYTEQLQSTTWLKIVPCGITVVAFWIILMDMSTRRKGAGFLKFYLLIFPEGNFWFCISSRQILWIAPSYLTGATAAQRGPVNSPHKGPATRKMFPFDDLIVNTSFPKYHTRSTYEEHFLRDIDYDDTNDHHKVTFLWRTPRWHHNHKWQQHAWWQPLVQNMLTIVTWWRHRMKTFSALLVLSAGNSPVTMNSPHKGQWRGALMFSFISAWKNGWVNNRDAGDLRSRGAHYDVNTMNPSRCFLQ